MVVTVTAADFMRAYTAVNNPGLIPDDWGKIVQPKDDGGRTTSVSIMNRTGIQKMCAGWIAVIDELEYILTLAKRKWIGYRVDE